MAVQSLTQPIAPRRRFDLGAPDLRSAKAARDEEGHSGGVKGAEAGHEHVWTSDCLDTLHHTTSDTRNHRCHCQHV